MKSQIYAVVKCAITESHYQPQAQNSFVINKNFYTSYSVFK